MEKERICNFCNEQYTDDLTNKFELHIKDYCKFLGSCNDKCFYSLPLAIRNKLFMSAIYKNHKEKNI